MVNFKVQPFLFDGALQAFRENLVDEALKALYSEIPSGQCSSCGACCYDNVPLSAGEFLAIVDGLERSGTLSETLERVAKWYVYQFNRVQPCVFLDDKMRCQIYDYRPLVCRLFGHQTPEEQARRVDIVLSQNKDLAKAVKEAYDINIHETVVNHVIRQCDFIPDKPFDKALQDKSFDAVQQVDLQFYQEGLIDLDYINLSLIEWFVLAYLDEDALLDQTLAVNTGG